MQAINLTVNSYYIQFMLCCGPTA